MTSHNLRSDTRAVGSTIGFVLILSMVIVSAGLTITVGAAVISESQTEANEESIDQAMTQFDSQSSLVAFEGGSEQTVDLSVGSDEQLSIEDAGHITVEVQTVDENDPTQTETVATVLDQEFPAMEYQTDNREIAYQGGGVWAKQSGNPNTAEMVSPPEFSYEGDTATLPLVNIAKNDDFVSADGEVTMQRSEVRGLFPDSEDDDLSNPVSEENDIVLTIQSPYYQAWGDYFEERVGVNPVYDHDANEVEVIIVTEGEEQTVTTAVTSVGGDQRIELRGQGTSTIVDSYDSNEGEYTESYSQEGTIDSESGIDIANGVVRGSVVTEGDLVMRGNARITGDAAVGGKHQSGGGSQVDGEVTDDADVQSFVPINQVIEQIREDLESDNDNNEESLIEDGEITSDRLLNTENSETTIHSGEYHLSEFDPDEDIRFDLSDGSVTLMVDDSVDLTDSSVTVENIPEGTDHRVELYTRGDQYELSEVSVEGDRAPRMWFYGGAGTNIDIHDSVTGVLYAPGTDEIPGDVTVHSHADLYGASVGGNTEVQNQASYHYDMALKDTPVFNEPQHVDQVSATVSYFHISYTEIELED